MIKCPESLEESNELEKILPRCRKELFDQAKARINAGTAKSERDAARQITREVGKSEEAVHKQIFSERKKRTSKHVNVSSRVTKTGNGYIINVPYFLPGWINDIADPPQPTNSDPPALEHTDYVVEPDDDNPF